MLMPGFRLATDGNGMLVASQILNSYSTGFSAPISYQRAGHGRLGGILQLAGLSQAQSRQLGQTMAANGNTPFPPLFQNGRTSLNVTTGVQDSVTIPIGQMIADAQNSALAAQQRLNWDVQTIEADNAATCSYERSCA